MSSFRLSDFSINHFDGLPDELLAEIFSHCTHEPRALTPASAIPHAAQRQLRTLSVITSVCSRWRNSAVGTSMLWTWIVVTSQILEKSDVGRSIIEAFIGRSRNRLIQIALFPPLDITSGPDAFMRVYEALIPQLHRCSSFWCFQLGNALTPLIFPLYGPMPRLTDLVLMGDVDISPVTVFTEPSSLTELRDATITGVPIAPIPNNPIEWLTLSINETSPTWTLPLIASSVKAINLVLKDGDMLGDFPNTHVSLPNLKILHQNQFTVSPFLNAPAMDELHWTSCWLGAHRLGREAMFPHSCLSPSSTCTALSHTTGSIPH
ncbi:hypothetical protein DL93DRAFT_1211503 [Clavulina sp. PMI_390]|nr:hypothetical protein DL93DRAFT_1211503 [Clavulina sp. PMI_390]